MKEHNDYLASHFKVIRSTPLEVDESDINTFVQSIPSIIENDVSSSSFYQLKKLIMWITPCTIIIYFIANVLNPPAMKTEPVTMTPPEPVFSVTAIVDKEDDDNIENEKKESDYHTSTTVNRNIIALRPLEHRESLVTDKHGKPVFKRSEIIPLDENSSLSTEDSFLRDRKSLSGLKSSKDAVPMSDLSNRDLRKLKKSLFKELTRDVLIPFSPMAVEILSLIHI